MDIVNLSTTRGFENLGTYKNASSHQSTNTNLLQEQILPAKNPIISEQYNFDKFSQLSVLRASTQITLSNSLRETIKHLQAQKHQKVQAHVFGELWKIVSTSNEDTENSYHGDLLDFEISENTKNIFAA